MLQHTIEIENYLLSSLIIGEDEKAEFDQPQKWRTLGLCGVVESGVWRENCGLAIVLRVKAKTIA